MSLWLDGGFWGPWIRRVFIREVEWARRSLLDHMLPSIPDAQIEADRVANEAWEAVMSQPSDGSDNPADFVEFAQERGIEMYMRLSGVRQAAANMGTVMLWQLLEQQMLLFHMRQVLKINEEQDVRRCTATRDKLLKLGEFHRRLEAGGCSMKNLPAWSKVDELRLVANAVKHGPGQSLDQLNQLRPDLLVMPGAEELRLTEPKPGWVERPAGGEDLYIADEDLRAYFDAAANLWRDFSFAIEKHSDRGRGT